MSKLNSKEAVLIWNLANSLKSQKFMRLGQTIWYIAGSNGLIDNKLAEKLHQLLLTLKEQGTDFFYHGEELENETTDIFWQQLVDHHQ